MKIIRLKDLRTFYDLSQEDIAKIFGIKGGTYSVAVIQYPSNNYINSLTTMKSHLTISFT